MLQHEWRHQRRHDGGPGVAGPRNHHHERERMREGHGPDDRHGAGPGAFGGFGRGGFGRGFGRGFGHAFGHAPAVRRGDVRSAILKLLAEEPMHGYQVIQQLGDRSRGMWRPSAGSVYPTLQQLEDEGLVRGEERDGRRVYSLTEQGRAAAAAIPDRAAPWESTGANDAVDLHDLIRQVLEATAQVSRVGGPQARAQARAILTETRRSLYRILAEDESGTSADAATADASTPDEPAVEPDEHPNA